MEKNKFYIGTVIYNEDPTFAGRCKIRVYGLFDGLEDKFVPWFVPGNSEVFSTRGAGSVSVPKLGNIVRVKFSNDDLYSGEYYNLPCLDPDLVNEIKDDYLGTQVILYDAEAELALLYQVKTGFKIFHKGSSIILDPTGAIRLNHSNNSNQIEIHDDRIIITTKGNDSGGNNNTGTIDITSKAAVNITSDNVTINSPNIVLGDASDSVVKANALKAVLTQFAAIIDCKYPQGPQASSVSLANIGSNTVRLAK